MGSASWKLIGNTLWRSASQDVERKYSKQISAGGVGSGRCEKGDGVPIDAVLFALFCHALVVKAVPVACYVQVARGGHSDSLPETTAIYIREGASTRRPRQTVVANRMLSESTYVLSNFYHPQRIMSFVKQ